MVILGNPPYSYESINTDPWIVGLVRDYYQVDGKPLGERNPKGLLDDYVKFIRFAQHRVSETGYGIVALITNHGYLDNPTFRGMRQNLMQTFDEIYVLDLHGNSKKKEVCPDGSPDKNVFDIQQGVAISIFIKYENSQQKLATVYHADLWGLREVYENKELVGGKYHWLAGNDISSTEWKIIKPEAKFYLFNPQNTSLSSEYEQGWKVIDIMLVNAAGIKTHRDHFAIDFDEESIDFYFYRTMTFSDGLAAVQVSGKKENKWGYIDKSGKMAIEPQFAEAKGFSDGLAGVRIGNADEGKWGFIDTKGKFVVNPIYDDVQPFKEGMAAIQSGKGKDALWGFIEKKLTSQPHNSSK
jgi:predicted helicase